MEISLIILVLIGAGLLCVLVGIGQELQQISTVLRQINCTMIDMGRDLGVKVRIAEKEKPKKTAKKKPFRRKK